MRLAINPEFHYGTKHVDIKFHFLRKQEVFHSINIQYIPTQQHVLIFYQGTYTISIMAIVRALDTHYLILKWEYL